MPPRSSDYGVSSSAPGLWSRAAEGRRGVTERFSAEPVPYLSQEPLAAAEPQNGTLIQLSSVTVFTLFVALYTSRKASKMDSEES